MPAIRNNVAIAASPRTVWRALTTAEGLEKWLADEARIQGREGGQVSLVIDGVEQRGMIHRWRPISHVEFHFNRGDYPGSGSRLAFRVVRDRGDTVVTVVQDGSPDLDDPELREQLSARLQGALEALQGWLDGIDEA